MNSGKSIDDLSEELLLEIFSYLSFSDLVFSVQYVNRRWKRVSYDNELWKHITFTPPLLADDDSVVRTLKMTPKLKALILDSRPYTFPVLCALIKYCCELRRLEFHYYQPFNSELCKQLVRQCPKLECLQISHRVLDCYELSKQIGSLQNLKILKIGGWPDSEHPSILKPLASGCPALEYIDLTDTFCRIDDLKYFLMMKKDKLHTVCIRWSYDGVCVLPLLSDFTVLYTLVIDNYLYVDNKAAFKSIRTLKTVTSLSLLDFDDAYIEDVINIFSFGNMCQLVELTLTHYENYENKLAKIIVHNCPNLKKLFINECNSLSDKSVEDYDKLTNLQYVELKSSAITDVSVECLTRCKKLKHLSLENCFLVTESGMKLITDMGNLQILKLDSCDVTGLCWPLIPVHLHRLKVLSINYCEHVDEMEVYTLKQSMPHLNVQYLYN